MTEQSTNILIAKIDDGRFIAVHQDGPHFCFEGHSEQDVIDRARRGLDFYYGTEGWIEDGEAEPVSQQLVRATHARKRRIQTSMAA